MVWGALLASLTPHDLSALHLTRSQWTGFPKPDFLMFLALTNRTLPGSPPGVH